MLTHPHLFSAEDAVIFLTTSFVVFNVQSSYFCLKAWIFLLGGSGGRTRKQIPREFENYPRWYAIT
jgi:hypothetical protein